MKIILILFLIASQLNAQPSLICPLDLDLGCNPTFIPKPDNKIPNIPGRCKIISKTHIADVKSSIGCLFTIKRTYILINSCGQTITCVQTIRWKEDKTPPVIHCPNDTNLGCNPEPRDILIAPGGPFPVGLAPIAIDKCDGLIISKFVKDSVTTNGCETMIFRRFVATDGCGNKAFCTQKLTYIRDKKAPVILKCPDTLQLGCNPDLSGGFPVPTEFPDFEDKCPVHINWFDGGDVTVTNCIATFTRLWLVTDLCGNQSTCEQKIMWTVDGIFPVIRSCPASINYGCVRVNPSIPLPDLSALVAIDNCGPVDILVLPDSVVVEGCIHEVHRRYVARDLCGNKTRCIQSFKWKIISQPIVNVPFPNDLQLVCMMPDLATNPIPGTCDVGYPILASTDTLGKCPDNCTIIATWRKYDCFGNYEEHDQKNQITCGFTQNLLPGQVKPSYSVTTWKQLAPQHWQLRLSGPPLNGTLSVIDLFGRTLFLQKLRPDQQDVDIKLDWVHSGLYLLVLRDGPQINTQKVLITR